MFGAGLLIGVLLCVGISVFDDLWLKFRREAWANKMEKRMKEPPAAPLEPVS